MNDCCYCDADDHEHQEDHLFEEVVHDADGANEPQLLVDHVATASVHVDFLAFLEGLEVEAQAQSCDGAAGDDSDAAGALDDDVAQPDGGCWCLAEEHALVEGHALVQVHFGADDGAPVA